MYINALSFVSNMVYVYKSEKQRMKFKQTAGDVGDSRVRPIAFVQFQALSPSRYFVLSASHGNIDLNKISILAIFNPKPVIVINFTLI